MSAWEFVAICPLMTSLGTIHKGIGDGQFIFVSNKDRRRRRANISIVNCKHPYEYTEDERNDDEDEDDADEWLYSFHPTFMRHTAAMDEINKILYILDNQQNLHLIDFNKKQKTALKTGLSGGWYRRSIVIKNELHVFYYQKHWIWDDTQNEFQLQQNTPNELYSNQSVIIKILAQNTLFVIPTLYQRTNGIYSYNVINKVWKKSASILPGVGHIECCVTTNDNKHVIIMEKPSQPGESPTHFFVLDTEKMAINKSKVTTPSSMYLRHYQATIPNNKMSDELVSFGFVRNIWKNKEFQNLLFPPYNIIQIVSTFYNNDYVHLINVEEEHGKHWRIKLDSIFVFV